MASIKARLREFSILLNSIPSWLLAFFVASLIAMNLLANKSINGLPSWLALDSGFIFSWVAFAVMDIVVKRFGAKAANMVSIVAILLNLFVVLLFYIASLIPGDWSTCYGADGTPVPELNVAVNSIFCGSWFVVFGSTLAIIVSTVFNNFMNVTIGKLFAKSNFRAYAARSIISTFLGQFVDNMVFAFVVSVHFFGWTTLQAVTCSITGGIAELLFEVILSPLCYRVVLAWEKNNVGKEYIEKYC
ncbi:MAG: VUT family protein [Treponema sp.]|nr:VUT family protein [Candidatus Treponema equi]